MSYKPLTVSLVIPVYNEESHLAACLRSALAQTVPFDEIIVVDNNSTDDTVLIASNFTGVTVLSQQRQGVVYARNRGFDAAKSDIVARIDADTILPTNWNSQIHTVFTDATVAAVSGGIHYQDIAASWLVDAIDKRIRAWLSQKMWQRRFLLGANMAIRRAAWTKVRALTCAHKGIHEDMDLALHLSEVNARVDYAPQLLAGVSGRRADTNIIDFVRYLLSLPASYASHGARESRYMYPVIVVVLLHYLPLRVLYRGYDTDTQQFMLRRLMGTQLPARVNPTVLVD